MEKAIKDQTQFHDIINVTLEAMQKTQSEVCHHWEKGLRETQEWMATSVTHVHQQIREHREEIPRLLQEFWDQRKKGTVEFGTDFNDESEPGRTPRYP